MPRLYKGGNICLQQHGLHALLVDLQKPGSQNVFTVHSTFHPLLQQENNMQCFSMMVFYN
jgi:hypothetical protein